MSAEDIRANLARQLAKMEEIALRDKRIENGVIELLQYSATMEIAAQLSELNENLKEGLKWLSDAANTLYRTRV